jgi:2-polyprenyl-3-methyl-5-hydroxy-6-metoxy-1,4-benzoquinol methylase
MEHLAACPVCHSSNFEPFIEAIDQTVSRETFSLVKCLSCGFVFTNPRPFAAELGKYYKSEDYISHSDTSKGFINSTYQTVRKYTLLKKLQLISRYFKTGNVLDIGCGTGDFLKTMKDAKWEVQGVEPDADARRIASEKLGTSVLNESEMQGLPNEHFHVITMWHVLEHVPDLNKRVEELKRLLKPNGLIIVAVPNRDSLDAKIYGNLWAAYDVPRHLYHFRPKDIELLFKNHGMRVTGIKPMVFDSFYVSMLSEKAKSGKTNLIRSTWNGLRSNLSAMVNGKTYSSQIYIIRK